MAASLIRHGSRTRLCPLVITLSRTNSQKLKTPFCACKTKSGLSADIWQTSVFQRFSTSSAISAGTSGDHKAPIASSPMTAAAASNTEGHSEIKLDKDLREHYVPVTRQALVRRLIEEKHFLTEEERKMFPDFVRALDTALVNKYHGILKELKVLFDPINPDNDTPKSRDSTTRKERLDKEYILLQLLENVLAKARFQELTDRQMERSLRGHVSWDGVRVNVEQSRYDVLRFWVLGHEVPEQQLSFSERIFNKLLRRASRKPAEFYKRIVVALRLKKDTKLVLKAFKEVPVEDVLMLVPDGRIHMSTVDKTLLVGSAAVASLGILAKLSGPLLSLQLDWALLLTLAGGAASLYVWSNFTERRNSYLVDTSRILYFKNISGNKGLLTLLVDRAEDESLKEALLAYTFLLTSKPYDLRNDERSPFITLPPGGLSGEDLKEEVERWLQKTTGMRMNFDALPAVETLKNFGIVSEKQGRYHVLRLDETLKHLPQSPQSVIARRATEVDMAEGYDRDEYLETVEEYKAEDLRARRYGWF